MLNETAWFLLGVIFLFPLPDSLICFTFLPDLLSVDANEHNFDSRKLVPRVVGLSSCKELHDLVCTCVCVCLHDCAWMGN